MPRKNTKKEKVAFKPMKIGEVRSSITHNTDGTLKKPKEKKFSWKEHNKWLDSFRGKIISKEYEEEEQRQKTINYAEKQNKKRKTS